jgi:excisionase family DNA binding protein
MESVQPNVKVKRRSRVPNTQTSPFELAIEEQSAPVESSSQGQENLTANRAGDRRSTAPPSPLPPNIALAYRVNDAVKISGLGRSTIYKLIGEGKLRSVLVAGRRLIPADALRSLVGGS